MLTLTLHASFGTDPRSFGSTLMRRAYYALPMPVLVATNMVKKNRRVGKNGLVGAEFVTRLVDVPVYSRENTWIHHILKHVYTYAIHRRCLAREQSLITPSSTPLQIWCAWSVGGASVKCDRPSTILREFVRKKKGGSGTSTAFRRNVVVGEGAPLPPLRPIRSSGAVAGCRRRQYHRARSPADADVVENFNVNEV